MNYHRRQQTPYSGGLPPAVSLNAPANQVSANNHIFPGFFAGFMGHGYDPMFVSQHADKPDFQPLPTAGDSARSSGFTTTRASISTTHSTAAP